MRPIIDHLLDLVFPPRCAACRAFLEGSERHLCVPCAETLVVPEAPLCPRCALPEAEGFCQACRESPPAFTRITAAFLYGGALSDAIERFKYQEARHLAGALIALSQTAARAAFEWSTLVVPIPLHAARLRQRGFNQALVLARPLARQTNRPVRPEALVRTRATRPQVGQSRTQRLENVKDAFRAEPCAVQDARLLLVDDVVTTSATVREASLAAMRAGAREVRVFCLARAFEG
ncbi:MAG: ComF family protein [Myxococcales bacterium]|jgi:ComF family protein|nr:ComF family protein [Myxococcales bacterium]